VTRFLQFLKAMARQRGIDEEFEEEIAAHLAIEKQQRIEVGESPEQAGYSAQRSFGNSTRLKEEIRGIWRVSWIDQAAKDLRYAFRVLRRNPGFTTVTVLTLALGIGMNTAVFSVIDAVLLQPLPYPNPERLVWISHNCRFSSEDCFGARSDYRIYRQQAHSFEAFALIGNEDLALVSEQGANTERIGSIEGDFWNITGAEPVLGRLFADGEPNAIVLTWGLFQRTFGCDPKVLGKSVLIEDHPFTIVGVLPKTFRHLFPQALYTGDEIKDIDGYISTPPGHELPGNPIKADLKLAPAPPWFRIVAKLKPNVSLGQAYAEMRTIDNRILKQYPNRASHNQNVLGLRFETVKERLVSRSRPTLLILFGAVGFVLLIAVTNVANLLLARASTRDREIALRAVLGAGRSRVIRQFLVESMVLGFLGGTAGIAVAYGSLRLVSHFGLAAVPRLHDARVDTPVLFFALVISVVTGLLFGVAPAWILAKRDLGPILKQDARTSSASVVQLRVRGIFVIGEVALAMILLIAAGLMLRSFWRMNSYPPGVDPRKILTLKISLSGPQYDRNWPSQRAYLQELFSRLETLPGVRAFGIDCGRLTQPLRLDGVSSTASEPVGGGVRFVSHGYLRALGIPLRAGRWPKSDDEMLDVALVNEKFVHETGAHDIVGRHIQGSSLSASVAGVVADFKDWQLDSEPTPDVYTAYAMDPSIRTARVVVRTAIDPQSIASPLRQLISTIDKNVPIFQLQTLEQELSNSIAPRRFNMALLAAFAATAVLLALTGIYGLVSYSVNQRTAEIGIRMALGATREDIMALVLRRVMAMVAAGIALGILGSFTLTRVMVSMLYNVAPNDPATFAAVTILLTATALLACCVPALQAALVEPWVALRHD
jgi:predicted permease